MYGMQWKSLILDVIGILDMEERKRKWEVILE